MFLAFVDTVIHELGHLEYFFDEKVTWRLAHWKAPKVRLVCWVQTRARISISLVCIYYGELLTLDSNAWSQNILSLWFGHETVRETLLNIRSGDVSIPWVEVMNEAWLEEWMKRG
jgi:hypothetical protein